MIINKRKEKFDRLRLRSRLGHRWRFFKLNQARLAHQQHCEEVLDAVRELCGKPALYKKERLQINVAHYVQSKNKIKQKLISNLKKRLLHFPIIKLEKDIEFTHLFGKSETK